MSMVKFNVKKNPNKITSVFYCVRSLAKNALVYVLANIIAIQPIFAAGIVPGGGAVNVGTSGNVPVLNINAPSNAGVSHNKFNEFNVGPDGLIINNLNMKNYNPGYTSALSGEHVEFNYNLGTGDAARVILNEVIGNSISELKGTTEIYGARADYIVANPNGITCAGCGFINTGRLSLITGSANMSGGDIDGFDISGTGVLRINGVDTAAFGMHAPTHADLVSNAIKIAGSVDVDGDLNIYSGNDKFDYKNKIVSSDDNVGVSVAVDSTALGGMKANNIRIIATQRGFGVNTAGNLVSDMGNVEITADGDIVMKNVAATKDVRIESKSQNIHIGNGTATDVYAKNNVTIKSAGNITTDIDAKVVAQNNMAIHAGNNLKNIGKINAGGTVDIAATNVHNYGQILGSQLGFSIDNDLINYRAAAILSAGDIDFNIGRDIVNYRAEIFALGDITMSGRDDLDISASGLSITSANMAAMRAKYDNPYIDAESTPIINPPVVLPPEPDEEIADINLEFQLVDDTIISIPPDAFADDATAGTTYTNSDGYIFILGTESTIQEPNPDYANCMADPICDETLIDEFITTYSYSGNDTFTVKDKNPDSNGVHQTIAAVFLNLDDDSDADEVGSVPNPALGLDKIPVQNGGGKFTSDTLDDKKSALDEYTFSDNLMGTLLNWAGRIESGGNMEINADKIMNKGMDINTGAAAVNKVYTNIGAVIHSYWRVIGYESITGINLDSISAQLISGGDMMLNGNNILNQSAVISSKGDLVLNATNSIKNQTYSEVTDLSIRYKRRKWKRGKYRNSYKTETEQKRIYSAQRSMILSGGNLLLKSNTLENDQVLDPLAGFDLNMPMPDEVNGGVSVDTRLPVGENGLFVVRPDGKYLVETNVSFIDPNDFYGSGYFFEGLGGAQTNINTSRILGDAAYETRIITDAYIKATGDHWRDNNGVIGSNKDMMKSLYDNAIDASKSMDLKVGVALTADQIANLRQDIIWYVTETVDGHSVLVPKLYLAQATLDSIDDTPTSRISGVTVVAENDFMVNVGTISADTLLAIDTGTLINESNDKLASISSGGALRIDADRVENKSAAIVGAHVKITADELINETKKLTDDRYHDFSDGYEKYHIEAASHTATISGTNGVDIELTGCLTNTGADIESQNGDINITADSVVFNTVQLYNSEESLREDDNVVSSKSTAQVKQSITNVGSNVNAGGNLNIKTDGDASFAGTVINAGGDANLDIGGTTTITAVMDSTYDYEKVDKSSWGGLVREVSINEMSDQNLKSSSLNVVDGLVINSGNNFNLIASDINVGGDAIIDAGDSINILSAAEVDTVYSYYKKTNYISDVLTNLTDLALLALAPITAGASLALTENVDFDCTGGSCGASIEIGSQTKDESFTKTTTNVGSAINVGGDLSMHADRDINVVGSDIATGGDGIVSAGNNINVIESKNTTETKTTHEDTTITAGVRLGNSYVDAGYAAKALYDAGDAVVKASEDLKHIREAYEAGKASYDAVQDAELNLTMASLNLLNAELAAVGAAAGAVTAANSSLYTGMYASGSIDYDTTKTTNTFDSSQSVASNISGANLGFITGNDMTQSGSNVYADGMIIYDIGNDLNVLASTDTYKTTSGMENIHAGASVGNNALQISGGYNQSNDRTSGTTHNNSTINADNIVINTGGDATFAGANVHADDTLAMDIGGDLNVESKQDGHYAKGSNWGVNATGGTGIHNTNKPSGGGGFNVGKSNSDSMWVNDQTSLTGNKVEINVDGTTTVTGGIIAALDKDGTDNGQLNLVTGEFEYRDLYDYDYSSESGFGIQSNWGEGTDQAQKNKHSNGTTTLTVKDKGHDTEQTTHATIGKGSITVDGTDLGSEDKALSGLNRDTENTQEITKDEITGALDGSVTIDNRLLTSEGRKHIAEQHKQVGEAVEKAWDKVSDVFDKFTKQELKDMAIESTVKSMVRTTEDAAKDSIIKPIKPEGIETKEQAIEYLASVMNYNDLTDESKGHVHYIIENFELGQDFLDYKKNAASNAFYSVLEQSDKIKLFENYQLLSEEGKKEAITMLVSQTTQSLGISDIKPVFESMGEGSYGEYSWDEKGNEVLKINIDYLNDFLRTMDTIGHEVVGHKMTKNIIESGVRPEGMSDAAYQDMVLSYTNLVKSYVSDDPYYEPQQSEVEARHSGTIFSINFEINNLRKK